MRSLILMAALPCLGAMPYTWGTKIRLGAGAESLRVVHSIDGVEQPFSVVLQLPLRGAAYQKVTIWGTRYRNSLGETSCDDPCSLAMPLHYGPPKVFVELFNNANNRIGESEWHEIPQAVSAPLTSYTMPLEVIGFEGYRLPVQVSTRPSVSLSGTMRLYARIHRPGYEGKGRVRVNNGPWIEIKRSNVMSLGNPSQYTYTSLDFSQSTLEMTIDLPPGTIRSGNNVVEWQFSKEKRASSGYRVLKFNFLQPAVSVCSHSVSGSTVTINTCGAHGYTIGDDVRIEGYQGINWQLANFRAIKRNITVVDSDTFTFTESGLVAESKNYPGFSVSKLAVDDESFTEENPATWTAPSGSNSSSGATAANSANLLDPVFPGAVITAKCTSCHANGLRDMKYFNYSNWSNIVRAQAHGLSEQQGKNIAAYVRSNTSTAPGRPWNPPYQPSPQASIVSPYDWSGSGNLEDIVTEYGMVRQLAANGTSFQPSDFSPSRTIAARDIRISFQLPDWNDWLPHIHPQDWWNKPTNCSGPGSTKGCWATSTTKAGYDAAVAAYSPHCPGAGCAAYAATVAFDGPSGASGKSIVNHRSLDPNPAINGNLCVGDPPDVDCARNIKSEANLSQRATYDAGLWAIVKAWEGNHEFDLQGYGAEFYPRGGAENSRVARLGAWFNTSPNLMRAQNIAGIFDGTSLTEKFMSMQWYQVALIVNGQNNKCCPNTFTTIAPLDVPYTYGYHKDLQYAGVYLPLNSVQWLLHQYQRYINMRPNLEGTAWGFYTIDPTFLSSQDRQVMWLGVPAADRMAVRASAMNAMVEKHFNLVTGAEANGTETFNLSMWSGWPGYSSPGGIPWIYAFIEVGGSPDYASKFWHQIIYGGAYGLSSTLRNSIAAYGASIWDGTAVNNTLASGINNSVTTISLSTSPPQQWSSASHMIQIGSEKMLCSSRSGTTLNGCVRGSDGTTPASHSGGATVQFVVRWARAATLSCTLDADGLQAFCPDVQP